MQKPDKRNMKKKRAMKKKRKRMAIVNLQKSGHQTSEQAGHKRSIKKLRSRIRTKQKFAAKKKSVSGKKDKKRRRQKWEGSEETRAGSPGSPGSPMSEDSEGFAQISVI